MSMVIVENDALPSIYGGYIFIKKDGHEFYIASVPSLMLGSQLCVDSIFDNCETFADDEGNEFEINISSSNVGVDWALRLSAQNSNDKALSQHISMEYKSNDY